MRRGRETEVKASEQLLAGLRTGGKRDGREKAVACGISDCSFGGTEALM